MEENGIVTTGAAGKPARTPAIIAGEIRTFTASMLNNIIEIGRRLCEAKELLPYGEFGAWVKRETGYSSSTAGNFMRLYQEYGADQGSLFGAEVDSQTIGKLSYTKALALLQVPREERETVAAELDAEHLSTRELEAAIRERDEAIRARNKALQEAEEAHGRIKELEARPVEVVVGRDEKAIQAAAEEARKKAEAAGAAEVKRLEAELKEAQKAREDAEAALKNQNAKGAEDRTELEKEAETARAEAETLRKKLKAAESGAGAASALAGMAQQNLSAALDLIRGMKETHPETAEKLLAGMEQILLTLLNRVYREQKGTAGNG